MAYSMDYRRSVARAYDEGASSAEVAAALAKPIHPGTVCRALSRLNLP